MHELFAAPRSEVTLRTVEDFVALRIPENLTLEYKLQGDKPLEAVAAMANTYGGLLLYGVGEGSEPGVPAEIRGVSPAEKDKLVNRMSSSYDPPWNPEFIAVPVSKATDKVVLVIRVDRDTVPAPIVLDGRIMVRLDGRNVAANRQMMTQLLTQPQPAQDERQQLRDPYRSPTQHHPFSVGQGSRRPELVMRAVASIPLPLGRRRRHLPPGMPAQLIDTLDKTRILACTQALAIAITGPENCTTQWTVQRSTSHQLIMMAESAPNVPEVRRLSWVRSRVTVSVEPGSLEVVADVATWHSGPRLEWALVPPIFCELVPAVTDVLLPGLFSTLAGPALLLPPPVEVHFRAMDGGVEGRNLEDLVNLSSLGPRAGGRVPFGGQGVVDETLAEDHNWTPAVTDALTTIVMDWGFHSPTF